MLIVFIISGTFFTLTAGDLLLANQNSREVEFLLDEKFWTSTSFILAKISSRKHGKQEENQQEGNIESEEKARKQTVTIRVGAKLTATTFKPGKFRRCVSQNRILHDLDMIDLTRTKDPHCSLGGGCKVVGSLKMSLD